MGKPSVFYLVYDDKDGSFVNVNRVQSVTVNDGGSHIHLKNGTVLSSPFKPRQILHKIRVIRRNMRLEADARRSGVKGKVGAPAQSEPPEEVD